MGVSLYAPVKNEWAKTPGSEGTGDAPGWQSGPAPALSLCPGQRWDEVVFTALFKTEWWMCWKGGRGTQRCL